MLLEPRRPESFSGADDKDLVKAISEGHGSIANASMIGELIMRLRSSIEKFDKASSKQTRQMIWLTWGIFLLTLVLIIRTFI